MAPLFTYAVALAMAAGATLATDIVECGLDKKCPEDTPCCSQYGQCGLGAYCLGGCDPRSSFSLDSCTPEPVCESKTFNWDNLDGVAPNTKYLGDASKADWVSSGQPLNSNGNLLLTMAPSTVGTLLASNHYMWYGKTSARLKTSRGAGVVTAFILLSDVKDEIDFEFVGVDLDHAQTNYYYQGITDYTHGKNVSAPGTFDNYHTYEIDWKPDSVTWSVDGNVLRTLNRKDTFNSTTNKYSYPQTPARVQLSLWPAGIPSNAKGTVDWAGGMIDWNSDDIKQHGYYYATFDQVTIECYDPPSDAKKNGSKSYIYTDAAGTEDTVEITDKNTVLKSLMGSGLHMDAGEPSSSSSGSSPTQSVNTIPGLNGVGVGNHGDGSDGQGGASSGGSSTGSGAQPTTTDFTQGGNSPKSGSSPNERMMGGSLFAVLVAVVVLVTM